MIAYGAPSALAEALAPLSGELPLIVVDNSSDVAVREVAHRAGAEYIDPGTNLGFARGVNLGLNRVDPAHDVLLLNPDAVLQPSGLRELHQALHADERIAAVAPALAGPAGAQRLMWPFPSPARAWVEALGGGALLAGRREFLVGAVLLLKRRALEAIGDFDGRFFLYAEEADWQLRATRQGWVVCEVPSVTAMHVGGGTSSDEGRRESLFHAGQETYVRKWFGGLGWQSYRLAVLVGATARSVAPGADTRRRARQRVRLYAGGPRRLAAACGLLPT